MLESTRIDAWLEGYRAAWASDDPQDVRSLFTEEVRYFTAPYDPPLEGVAQVIDYWLGEREAGIPWAFEYEVAAQGEAASRGGTGSDNGDLYVVRAVVTYPEGTHDAAGRGEIFHDVWFVTLAGDGRASEFVEYWMLVP
jgi:hypothetical protein